ncbi:hypothetical protein [Alkalihalobacillus sp. LMS39]|uniref:hypothetical protein n=1 Tax=Alkalihalobacillus sp. LMS39 TaxID=2924032 RepID=UPI001FB2034A|nr:hypothetical protein [Alkalihalobacillus sp. LMS39]UOE93358.1 hypothetical protein MM271_19505 [Alkalihalobacillus sp. LMS39]
MILEWKKVKTKHIRLKIPYLALKKRGRPLLVPVSLEPHKCKNAEEKALFQMLLASNYYPTPYYKQGRIKVNMALVPFRIALLERSKANKVKIEKGLAKKGWTVIYYDAEEQQTNFENVLQQIQRVTTAYSHSV